MSPPGRAGRRPPPDQERPSEFSAHDSTSTRGHYGPGRAAVADLDTHKRRVAGVLAYLHLRDAGLLNTDTLRVLGITRADVARYRAARRRRRTV